MFGNVNALAAWYPHSQRVPEGEGSQAKAAIHCHFSQQRFHVCFETFHFRLLSRWAALSDVLKLILSGISIRERTTVRNRI